MNRPGDPVCETNRFPPSLLHRFKPLEVIGEGGMGVVWRVWDRAAERIVAIKMLGTGIEGAPTVRARMVVEALSAMRIRHECVVRTLDVIETSDGAIALLMEHVDGYSLRALSKWTGGWAYIRHILVDVLDALTEIHAAGIVHGDVKPENILITSATADDGAVPRAKLGDFGVAEALYSREGDVAVGSTERRAGTVVYMAPEQLIAGASASSRTDVYAFGVVAYELVVGRPPWRLGTERQELIDEKVRRRPPTLVPRAGVDLPDGAEALIRRCLSPEPLDRPAFVRSLRDELAALAPGGPVRVPPAIADRELAEPARESFPSQQLQELARAEEMRAEPPSGGAPMLRIVGSERRLRVRARTLPLRGRSRLLRTVRMALRRARRGEGPVLVELFGGSGVGKTRLLEQLFAELTRKSRIMPIHIVSEDVGAGRAVRQIVASALGLRGVADEVLAERLPRALSRLGMADPIARSLVTQSLIGESARRVSDRFLERRDRWTAYAKVLKLVTDAQPICLFVDAVGTSAEMDRFWRWAMETPTFEGARLAIVTTTSGQGPRFAAGNGATERRESDRYWGLEVRRLRQRHVAELVERLGVDEAARGAVTRFAAGYPLAAVEIAGFIGTGVVDLWELEGEEPPALDELLVRRFLRAGASRHRDLRVLRGLALGPRRIPIDLAIKCIAQRFELTDETPIYESILRLLADELIHEVAGRAPTVAFVHGMWRRALQKGATRWPDSRAWHAAWAEVLSEAEVAGRESAFQWYAAGEPFRACREMVAAGRRAMARGAAQLAVRCARDAERWATRASGDPDLVREMQMTSALLNVDARLQSDGRDVSGPLSRALRYAEGLELGAMSSEIVVLAAETLLRAERRERATELLDRLLARFARSSEPQDASTDVDLVWARAACLRAGLAIADGDLPLADRLIRRARDRASEAGDKELLAETAIRAASVAEARGELRRAELQCAAATEIFNEVGNRSRLARTLAVAAALSRRRGRPGRSLRYARAGIEEALACGDRVAYAELQAQSAVTKWMAGIGDDAAEDFERARESGVSMPNLELLAALARAVHMAEEGELDETIALLRAEGVCEAAPGAPRSRATLVMDDELTRLVERLVELLDHGGEASAAESLRELVSAGA